MYTPNAEMRNPLLQHAAETTPTLLGPASSNHGPANAAERPRNTIARVNDHPMVVNFQSPGADWVMPMARDSGTLNTLIAYAWPMQRCIASAAGGTSQRLYPGGAVMRSLSSTPI